MFTYTSLPVRGYGFVYASSLLCLACREYLRWLVTQMLRAERGRGDAGDLELLWWPSAVY